MKVGREGAKALLKIVAEQLEGTQVRVSRAQVLDLPNGGGALLVVWGQDAVPRAAGGDLSPLVTEPGQPDVACPECGGAPVGMEDGDGELTCLACGHEWRDDRFDDSKG